MKDTMTHVPAIARRTRIVFASLEFNVVRRRTLTVKSRRTDSRPEILPSEARYCDARKLAIMIVHRFAYTPT